MLKDDGAQPSEADDDALDDVERARARTAGWSRRVLVGTLLGAAVFVGLALYGDLPQLRASLAALPPTAFALAVALATGNYGLRYLRWHYYLRLIDVRIPHRLSASVFFAGFVMSVTPGKLGEVFKSLLLYEARGTSIARTAPVIFAERLTDLIALVILTAFGCLAFDEGIPVAVAGAVLALFLVLASSYRPLGELLLRIAEQTPVIRRGGPRLREAYESLLVTTRPGPMAVATALSVVSWGLECLALYILLGGLPGGGLSIGASTFAYSASTIVGALAMMPGGLGVTEAGMTGLVQTLSHDAIDASTASLATMLTRLATLWWAVLVGAIALPFARRQVRRAIAMR